eukprot:m.124135 g.124135  ORF g.124135 m.124135 type:complete len:695 (-) comp14467_c0_seq5:1372-3456(-)
MKESPEEQPVKQIQDWKYTEISKVEYVTPRPPRSKERLVCECEPETRCDENCLNRLMMIECNSASCPCGVKCNNRRFQKSQNAKIAPFYCGPEKGMGLRACQDIRNGDFISEYLGEIISKDMFASRCEEYKRKEYKHFYFMNLHGDLIIDATMKGSAPRFTNHSCSPNAELQKWTVNGEFRVGFFATKNIKKGSEISIEYQYGRAGEAFQKCFCGSENCRGDLSASKDGSNRRNVPPEGSIADIRRRLKKLVSVETEGIEDPEKMINLMTIAMQVRSNEEAVQEIVPILSNSTCEESLQVALKFRGMSVLTSFLSTTSDDNLKLQVLEFMDRLPLMSQNLAEDAGVFPILDTLIGANNKLSENAKELKAKWKSLKLIYVIPKTKNDIKVESIPIPRPRLKEFPESLLRKWGTDFDIRIVFSKDNSNRDSRELKLTGSVDGVDDATETIKTTLASEPVKEEPRRKRSDSISNLDTPESKRSRRESFSDTRTPRRIQPDVQPEAFALPDGWVRLYDDSQHKFYFANSKLNVSQWEIPRPDSPEKDEKRESVEAKNEKLNLQDKPNRLSIAGTANTIAAVKVKPVEIAETLPAEPENTSTVKKFREEISRTVVKVLGRYRKKTCKIGRITKDEDFKYLARKITHIIMDKEKNKQLDGSMKLTCDEEVKHKVGNFVKSFMKKTGEVYKRSSKTKDPSN